MFRTMPTSEAIMEATKHLPTWVVWVSPIVVPAVSCLVGLLLSLLVLVVTRQRIPAGAPWHEVARLIFPRRYAFQILTIVGAMLSGLFGYMLTSPVSRFPPVVVAVLAVLVFPVFPVLISDRVLRSFLPRPSVTRQERSRNFVTGLLLGWLPLLPPLLGFLFLPTTPGMATWIGMLLLAVASVVLCSGIQIRVAERLGVVRRASERVQRAVERASERTGHRPRATFECDLLMANAFAFVWTGDLLFTRPAVEALTDAELEAVAMHELAHVAEPLKVRLSRLGLAPVMWGFGVARSLYTMGGEIALFLLLGTAMIGMVMMQRVAKRMETAADEVAGASIEDTPVYAHALEKIYRYNVVPAVMPTRGQVHPNLYDRMVAAGTQPDYPRPEPPNLRRIYITSFVLAFVFATLQVGSSMIADRLAREEGPAAAARLPWLIALVGSHQTFEEAADDALEEDRLEAAAALFRVALEQEERCFYTAYTLTTTEVKLGHCAEARASLNSFVELAEGSDDPSDREESEFLKKIVSQCEPAR